MRTCAFGRFLQGARKERCAQKGFFFRDAHMRLRAIPTAVAEKALPKKRLLFPRCAYAPSVSGRDFCSGSGKSIVEKKASFSEMRTRAFERFRQLKREECCRKKDSFCEMRTRVFGRCLPRKQTGRSAQSTTNDHA